MFHFYQAIQNRSGDALAGYYVQAVNAVDTIVTLASDNSGTPIITTSGIANMAKVGTNGMVSFYIADGNYTIKIFAPDGTTLRETYPDVPMASSLSLAIGTITTLSSGASATASINTSVTPALISIGIPTGPAGPNGGIGTSAGNAALFSVAAGMTIGAGITSFRTAGYSIAGLGGADYIYDASVNAAYVTANPRASFLAADTRGFRLNATQTVNVQMFGAVGDDVADDRPAFVAALAYLKSRSNVTTGNFSATPKLHVPLPPKAYYLSAGLNIHQSVHIRGDGSGQPDSQGTLLRFAANQDCIVINDYRTDANTTATGLGGAGGTIIEGLSIWGGGAVSTTGPYVNAASTTGRGIVVRTILVKIIDVFVAFNSGAGVDIHANAGSGGSTEGNANEFYCERVWSTYNGGDGIVVYGTDANAGTFVQCSAVSNAACGFKDYSFLGNTYLQCHARDNGIVDPTQNGKPTGMCLYAANRYYVVAGQEAAASTTTPGTNTAVWRLYSGGYGCRTWVSGMTWVLGAPYATNPTNTNARNVFTGCYAESGQSPAQAFQPTLLLGGLLEEVGVDGTAAWLRGGTGGGVNIGATSGLNGGGYAVAGSQASIVFGGSGGGNNDGSGNELLYHAIGSDNYRIKRTGTVVQRVENNSPVSEQYGLNSDASTMGPLHHWIARPFVGVGDGGNPTSGLRLGAVNATSDMGALAIPTSAQFFKVNPVTGGPDKYICTVGGSSYSTSTLLASGIVGGVQTATSADPAAITSAAGVNSVAAPTMAEFNALVTVVNAVRTDLAATRSALATLQTNMRAARQLAP